LIRSCAERGLLLVCRINSEFAEYGFPWKLGEYLMTKNPVLGARVGDIEKYLTDREEIYLAEPEDSQSIYDKMCEVFAQYDKARVISENGYNKAVKVFDYIERTESVVKFISSSLAVI
jgi:glycosyltransferase involved in cell wall biosynthesis